MIENLLLTFSALWNPQFLQQDFDITPLIKNRKHWKYSAGQAPSKEMTTSNILGPQSFMSTGRKRKQISFQ